MVSGTRWSGAEWGDQQKDIFLIGSGGIGSWTALSLARIGHSLFLIDGDSVDASNVSGGQLFRSKDIGKPKVTAVTEICRELGCNTPIMPIHAMYKDSMGMGEICITGLDNMKTRRQVYEAWKGHLQGHSFPESCLFMDARLTLEMFEVLCFSGDNPEAQAIYEANHLFPDEEANDTGCTTKQATFGAMGVASFITATLCNWLTNRKHGLEVRDVPFYQRMHFPMMLQTIESIPVLQTI